MLYIVIAPLIGAILNGILFSTPLRNILFPDAKEKRIELAVSLIACLSVFVSSLLSTYLFLRLAFNDAGNRVLTETVFTWISSGELSVSFEFLYDPLSAVMALVVTWVSFLIHIYSVGYMHGDRSYSRYFAYLNLFVFFMLLLILGNNFLIMFVGWEGVGLVSYLLIGFWFQDTDKSYAGRKAFIVNRIGDFGFILGIFLIFFIFGTLNFQEVFGKLSDPAFASAVSASAITAIALLLFVGAVGKSAQIPLYVWLPDAMAGPTPVSALIHAATMVTAGVYMVARCNLIYTLSPAAQYTVLIVAALTALVAALIAITQNDIKKVLAYSTVSQLGFMFMALGVGAYVYAVFHLVTHAFFKALLFLGSGSVIHALSGEQDIRKMGGLRKLIPTTSWTFLIGTMAISGVPLLSGFFSKDEILASVYDGGHTFIWIAGVLTAVLTAFYMMRLYILTFEGKPRMTHQIQRHVHESPPVMTVPLIVLAVLSVTGGYIGFPEFISRDMGMEIKNLIKYFLSTTIYTIDSGVPETVSYSGLGHWSLLGFSVAAAFTGIGAAILFYIIRPELPGRLTNRPLPGAMYSLSSGKFYVDEFYEKIFLAPYNHFSSQFASFDGKIIDGAVIGLGNSVQVLSSFMRRAQSGLVRNYAFVMFAGMILILAAVFFL